MPHKKFTTLKQVAIAGALMLAGFGGGKYVFNEICDLHASPETVTEMKKQVLKWSFFTSGAVCTIGFGGLYVAGLNLAAKKLCPELEKN